MMKDFGNIWLPDDEEDLMIWMMYSKKAKINCWQAADINGDSARIGLTGSPTQVMKIFYPPPRQGGQKLEGEPQEMAQQLATKLRELKLI